MCFTRVSFLTFLFFPLRPGVRDTVDLKLVLGRLEQLRWNVRDLVDYLTKQQPSFTPADWYKPPPTTDCSRAW